MWQKNILTLFIILLLPACLLYESASFEVKGDVAVMTGVIDNKIGTKLETLLERHPEVKTIIMRHVEGSVDDEANLKAASMVRERGLHTLIPADGLVASGGTDFFLAGVQRTVEAGAMIGVHSWSGLSVEGADLPRDHPEHQPYLRYYRAMGIPAEFYWYTLRAAPSDEMHWMSKDEQRRYRIAAP